MELIFRKLLFRNKKLGFLALLIFINILCKKEGFYTQNTLYSNDIRQYNVDSLLPISYATKSIVGKGVFPWKGNGILRKLYKDVSKNPNILTLSNFFEFNYNLRELVSIHIPNSIKINQQYKVNILDFTNYESDSLIIRANAIRFTDDGVPIGRFKLNPYYDNNLLITKFDTINKILQGRFNLSFIRLEDNTNLFDLGNNISFSDGIINANIEF